jgi:lipopolysaccharide export system permease protein
MKILDRYLAREMLSPVMVGVIGFLLVMMVDLLFTFVDLIINKGIPLGAVAQLLLFKLPSILVLTFPVATLFGVAMCLGRLSHDNELSALSTSGVNFKRIILPLLIISLLISGLSFITNEKVVPYANHLSEKIIRELIMKQPLPEIRENVFFKDAYNRHFYIKKIDTRTQQLESIMVYELTEEELPQVVTAKRAKLSNLLLTLYDGIIHKFDKDGHLSYEAAFEQMRLNLTESPLNIATQKTPQEMDSGELKGQIKLLEKGGINANALLTEFYMKYSVPLSAFIFALIGIPLSIPGLRSNRTWGLILTIVIMFTFYVFASVFRSLGRGGLIPPFYAAWTPQILFAILGIVLMAKELRSR